MALEVPVRNTVVPVRGDEQPNILIPGRLICDVEARQGLRLCAAQEEVSESIGRLNRMSA